MFSVLNLHRKRNSLSFSLISRVLHTAFYVPYKIIRVEGGSCVIIQQVGHLLCTKLTQV